MREMCTTTVATHRHPRARRAGPLLTGWVVLLTCAVVPVALFFAAAVAWRFACGQAPAYEFVPPCEGALNPTVTVIVPAAILALVVAGALAGLVCGVIVIIGSAADIRRIRGIWLAASAAFYAGSMMIRAANPVLPDRPLLSEIPYVAIRGAGALVIWLLVTGVALLVARAIRRVRSAH